MTQRTIGGQNYTLTYDAENRLTAVSGPNVSVSFAYDGDGNRVQADWVGSPDHTIIAYIGNIYEYQKVGTTSTTVRQYYYAGSTRIAMRQGSTLNWLFGDHLGSTSAVANEDGSAGPTQLYKPWGEKRPAGASSLPTT
jgi:YD repeat-containing protein